MLRIIIFIIDIIIFVFFSSMCSPSVTTSSFKLPSGPDLVIQSFEITEPTWLLGFKAVAKVVVQNVGSMPTEYFDVAIVGINGQGKNVQLYFAYDPELTKNLAAGEEITLNGEVGLHWHGHFDVCCGADGYDATCCVMHDEDSLWLMAITDYCQGYEMQTHCAVEEIDEQNNARGPIVVEKAS